MFVGEIKGGCGPPGRTGAGVEANRAEKRQKKKSFWRRAGAGFFCVGGVFLGGGLKVKKKLAKAK